MKHISLFSGIGGFDLAAEWMEWQNIASCEINSFSRRHLEFYWPNAYHHDDIHTLTFDLLNEEISKKYPDWQSDDIILTGGFPCQPYSQAGKRLGKEDERHLWPEMLRVIREVRPRYIVGENVGGIVNWSDGLVFEEVQINLENEGYEVQAFILPAAAVDAPHRRDRVWFIAKNTISNGCVRGKSEKERTEIREQRNACTGNSKRIYLQPGIASNANRNGQQRSNGKHEINAGQKWEHAQRDVEQSVKHGIITNTNNKGLERGAVNGGISDSGTKRNQQSAGLFCTKWQNFPTQSPVCTGNDGIPAGLDGITFSKWRNESIKAAGNAIVPQVALKIFQAIEQINNHKT
jgi:DNA (cytosine-5)-methyltransferase 1